MDTNETAIRTVIEAETQAYLDRNAGRQADCWATHTGLSQRISLEKGRIVAANGDQASLRRGLQRRFKELAGPDQAVFAHQDYRIRIRGDAAFVTFCQVMHSPGRPADYSQQVRYLEHEQDGWKIAHSGVMYYEPTPEETQVSRLNAMLKP